LYLFVLECPHAIKKKFHYQIILLCQITLPIKTVDLESNHFQLEVIGFVITSDFVSVCIIFLTFWKLVENTVEKRYGFQTKFWVFQKWKKYLQSSDSKTRMFVLSEYIYIISSYFKFVEQFRLKQKKKCTSSLKNTPIINYISNYIIQISLCISETYFNNLNWKLFFFLFFFFFNLNHI